MSVGRPRLSPSVTRAKAESREWRLSHRMLVRTRERVDQSGREGFDTVSHRDRF